MSQKKYISFTNLSTFLDNLKNLFAIKSEVSESISEITSGSTIVAKATEATHSDNSSRAEIATKAEQDNNGAIISSTYETKVDANTKLMEAKKYTNEEINIHDQLVSSHEDIRITINNLESKMALKSDIPQIQVITLENNDE